MRVRRCAINAAPHCRGEKEKKKEEKRDDQVTKQADKFKAFKRQLSMLKITPIVPEIAEPNHYR
jgi:hypothetical protein